jgi:hypothetical protein
MVALKNAEETLLSLQQALNSDPLPIDTVIQLYDALAGAPVLSIPSDEVTLQSFHLSYREQVEAAVEQATDLYNHVVQIQAGNAVQTEISAIHLSVARNAASASTSMVQGLIRELEDYLASLP